MKSFSITSKKLKSIGSGAFKGDKKLKTIKLTKTAKLTKKGVKNALKGSSVKTVDVGKKQVKSFKKFFAKSNSGAKVTLK